MVTSIYLSSKTGTIFRGFVSSPGTLKLPSHALGSSILISYPAWGWFDELFSKFRSQVLTTFITHFEWYAYQRLPFGITSGPELFQREMQTTLEGLDGVVCLMDDIVVYTWNQGGARSKTWGCLRQIKGNIPKQGKVYILSARTGIHWSGGGKECDICNTKKGFCHTGNTTTKYSWTAQIYGYDKSVW